MMPVEPKVPPKGKIIASPKSNGSGRKRAVLEMIGLAQIPLAGLAARDHAKHPSSPEEGKFYVSTYALDIATVEAHKEPVADAVVKLADNYPVLAALLDKLANTTPFGALITVVVTFALQIAENHRALPEAAKTFPGITPRDELVEQIVRESKEWYDDQLTDDTIKNFGQSFAGMTTSETHERLSEQ